MLYFGIEIELIVKPSNVDSLINLLHKNKDILLKNEKHNQYLFTDESLRLDSLFDYAFEVKTIKFKYNEENIKKFKNFLIGLYSICKANDSCGIHVHVSKDKYTLAQYYTLLYEYINKGCAKDLLIIDNIRMENYRFASYQACRQKYYNKTNSCIKKKEKYYIRKNSYSDRELYKIHHELNTIEYRGLRCHMYRASIETIMFGITSFLNTIDNIEIDPKIKNIFRYKK